MDERPRRAAFTALEAAILLGVVLVVGSSVATLLLRGRAPSPDVRVVSTANDVAACAFVTDVAVQIGNPNGNRFKQAQSVAADLAEADRDLRSRAASAGADTVLVTSRELLLRAKAYRCSAPR